MSASGQDPYVSVFHFTSRISSAKIRKYKMATEKGMGHNPSRRVTSPTPEPKKTKGRSASNGEPDPKRPKLKLNVRQPSKGTSSGSPDTIAVSRPRRATSSKVRYAEDMDVDGVDGVIPSKEDDRASPAASSDLTSLSSMSPLEPEPPKRKNSTPQDEYGRDFVSYYIDAAGEDEDGEAGNNEAKNVNKPAKAAPPNTAPTVNSTSASAPPATTSQQLPTSEVPRAPPVQRPPPVQQIVRFRNHMGPPTAPYPTSAKEKLPPPKERPPPPEPKVILVDNTPNADQLPEAKTAREIQARFETLGCELVGFLGVPPPAEPPRPAPPPPPQAPEPPQPVQQGPKTVADSLLDMMDDDDSDDKEGGDIDMEQAQPSQPNYKPEQHDDNPKTADEEAEAESKPIEEEVAERRRRLMESPLQFPGQSDNTLDYGVRFIMGALFSFAESKMISQYRDYYLRQHWNAIMTSQQWQKGRRPGRPRKFDEEDEEELFANLPPAVVRYDFSTTDEGRINAAFANMLKYLRVNTLLPQELARTISQVYRQLEQLINQGSQQRDPPWRYLSYGAQISAHKMRIEEIKEQNARAQMHLEREHMRAQQRMHSQMVHPQPSMAASHHAMPLQHPRPPTQPGQQPMDPLSIATRLAAGSSNSPGVGHIPSNQTPTILPYSGQAMTFSFAENTARAAKLATSKDGLLPRTNSAPTGHQANGVTILSSSPAPPPGRAAAATNMPSPNVNNVNGGYSDTIQVASQTVPRRPESDSRKRSLDPNSTPDSITRPAKAPRLSNTPADDQTQQSNTDRLRQMFPNVDDAMIKLVVIASGGVLQNAVDALLTMAPAPAQAMQPSPSTTNTIPPGPGSPHIQQRRASSSHSQERRYDNGISPVDRDAALARSLQDREDRAPSAVTRPSRPVTLAEAHAAHNGHVTAPQWYGSKGPGGMGSMRPSS